MEKIYEDIERALRQNEEIVVARIVSTSGSVPRKAGTTMMLDSHGRFFGTVGGGASEWEAQKDCRDAMTRKKSFTKIYSSCHTDSSEDGMICGGSLNIEFIYVNSDNKEFRKIFESWVEAEVANIRVWIAGAGHVAQALVPVLKSLSFDCHIVDDRGELLNKNVFPEAESFHRIDFAGIGDFIRANIREKDFVCIMTKGHKDDYATLVPALRSPAFYVGLMGSRSKIAALYKRLEEDGFTREEIKKCHSPIGIDISAETPLEVAFSVAGELIYTRAVLEGRNKY